MWSISCFVVVHLIFGGRTICVGGGCCVTAEGAGSVDVLDLFGVGGATSCDVSSSVGSTSGWKMSRGCLNSLNFLIWVFISSSSCPSPFQFSLSTCTRKSQL